MKLRLKFGNWIFEVTEIRARRVESFGDKYNGIASIKFVDGIPHIEGLLCKGTTFSKTDYMSFRSLFLLLGFKKAIYSRFFNDERKSREKTIEQTSAKTNRPK